VPGEVGGAGAAGGHRGRRRRQAQRPAADALRDLPALPARADAAVRSRHKAPASCLAPANRQRRPAALCLVFSTQSRTSRCSHVPPGVSCFAHDGWVSMKLTNPFSPIETVPIMQCRGIVRYARTRAVIAAQILHGRGLGAEEAGRPGGGAGVAVAGAPAGDGPAIRSASCPITCRFTCCHICQSVSGNSDKSTDQMNNTEPTYQDCGRHTARLTQHGRTTLRPAHTAALRLTRSVCLHAGEEEDPEVEDTPSAAAAGVRCRGSVAAQD